MTFVCMLASLYALNEIDPEGVDEANYGNLIKKKVVSYDTGKYPAE